MRKLLFALVMMLTGAFTFAVATPAKAMTAGPVTGMSDIVKPESSAEKVSWRGFCWRHPYHWRCRGGGYGYYYPRRYYYYPRRHHHYRHRHYRRW